ncbi:MAG: hypothetical protein ACOYXT_13945 [Bacteroidota bacterium]
MEDDKNKQQPGKSKIEEPYDPQRAPNPPQIIDPSLPDQRSRSKDHKKNKRKENEGPPKKTEPVNEKKMGESPTEIDDETTI